MENFAQHIACLKNQELLVEHIVGTAIEQLKKIQVNCNAEHAGQVIFHTAQEVLCEIFLGEFA